MLSFLFNARSPVYYDPPANMNVDVYGTFGDPVTRGQVVYFSQGDGGSTPGRWYLADASTAARSSFASLIGLAVNAAAGGTQGFIRIQGRLDGMNGLTAGQTYWISDVTPGGLRSSIPLLARSVCVGETATSAIITVYPLPYGFGMDFSFTDSYGVKRYTGTTDNGVISLNGGNGVLDDSKGGSVAVYGSAHATRPGAVILRVSPTGEALSVSAAGFINSPTQPRCSAFKSIVQVLATGANTALDFDTEDYDVGAMHTTGGGAGAKFTVPANGAGLYLLTGCAYFQSNGAAGGRIAQWRKNGATPLAAPAQAPGNAAQVVALQPVAQVVLAAGDFVELMAFQDSGANVNMGSAFAGSQNYGQIVKLW
jgi:hypothetical protein